VSSGAAAAKLRRWRALQFNFCGAAESRELCGVEGRNGKYVGSLRTKIVGFKPHVVTVNEICVAQYNDLSRRLRKSGWAMHGTFVTTHRASSLACPGNRRFGDAVFTRAAWSKRTVDCLSGCLKSKRRVEHRVGMCVTTRLRINTRVCVVHIGATRPGRQIADFIKELNKRQRTVPVLIGGDFNREPGYDDMDRVYYGGGRGAFGKFQEADACKRRSAQSRHCNESTRLSRKLDFVFLARRWFRDAHGDAGSARFSDHDPVRAWFRQCGAKVC
jgi:endonuclease/exonuclease/phosphatase family metal-dependent hydrolase